MGLIDLTWVQSSVYRVLLGFYWVQLHSLRCTGEKFVLTQLTGLDVLVWIDVTSSITRLPSFTGFHRFLLGFTRFY